MRRLSRVDTQTAGPSPPSAPWHPAGQTGGAEPVATFVLVHGAWGGAHGFRKVRRPLQSAGHEVFTPSLTGIGERAHLASPQVCLTTHIADVANAVLFLASDRSAQVTGIVLPVDGGTTAGPPPRPAKDFVAKGPS